MPRKPLAPSLADEHVAAGGVAAVDRAASLLLAFREGDGALTLGELAARTRLYKSTALRLLASLAHAGLLRRTVDGSWAPGPQLPRLAALYESASPLQDLALPVMQALVARTRESVALHVRQGDQRLCLLRVDSPQLLRDHVRAGDLLPLDRGAGGRVLLAFGGQRGKLYDRIRSEGHHLAHGDRVPGLAGISAPVWSGTGELVGALTLTVPESRFKPRLVDDLCQAALRLNEALASGR